jgi:TPP-dependent pyruvate/acetoin dehydrogenase alpha subunit
VKRYPAFDPPEYLDWKADPGLVAAFGETVDRDPARRAVVRDLNEDRKLELYAALLRTRLTDIALKRWVRQGVTSKAWLGTGEEAVTVGAVHALDRSKDVVAPMIRNAGACTEMGMPIADTFRAYLAAADSPSQGRDLHCGSLAHNVLQPISHVGDMVPVIAGIALSFKIRGESRVALTWVGDGSTKSASAHEGTNFAAVQKVPAILVVQNNQVALGTRLDQHHLAADFSGWAESYGMFGLMCDGNNVLDVYAATRLAAERCRAGEGPVLIVAETFRMGGHATHDEREARETFPDALFQSWGRRDPIGLYEEYLKGVGLKAKQLDAIEEKVTAEVEAAAEEALKSRDHLPAGNTAVGGVYANHG